ncbi:MAG: AAA family ATPase, partial [Microscillaceae bacterium]|nr:AAA family ATPase [Microscillaceae bacterium]
DYYVDKTLYIEQLEVWGEDFVSFLRPRRMGKSLFVSLLEYYYGKEHKDKFAALFGNYYIGQRPTPLANQFAVLKMDFSAIDTTTEERAYRGFLGKIQSYIRGFNLKYLLFSKDELEHICQLPSPELVMKNFFDVYQGEPIYFIIDEYDHFTNEILLQDLSAFKKAVTHQGYVRKFYEALKEATQKGIVNRLFITGVSPITLDALTSGFNIITHLTGEKAFHNMMGFTEAEVAHIIDLVLEDKTRQDKIMQDLRTWYNGYRFHLESAHRMYNSDMVLYFAKHFQRYQAYPRQMLDPNIAPDYGKLKKMFEIQDPAGNYATLEKILHQGQIADELIFQFSFDKGFSDAQFVSFLFYMGYLTIAGEAKGQTVFTVPNYVIQALYWEYFSWLLAQREQVFFDEHQIRNMVGEMTVGNIQPFMAMIGEVLKTLSNRDYRNFDEKYIKIVIISFMAQAGIYQIKSEVETSSGYIDILLLAPPTKKIEKEYIFELKYIKKKEARPEYIEAKKQEAQSQIRAYVAAEPGLQHNPKLLAYALLFVKDELRVEAVDLNFSEK